MLKAWKATAGEKSKIFTAIENNDTAKVLSILESNPAAIEYTYYNGETPLQLAMSPIESTLTKIEMVKLLVSRGAVIDRETLRDAARIMDEHEAEYTILKSGAIVDKIITDTTLSTIESELITNNNPRFDQDVAKQRLKTKCGGLERLMQIKQRIAPEAIISTMIDELEQEHNLTITTFIPPLLNINKNCFDGFAFLNHLLYSKKPPYLLAGTIMDMDEKHAEPWFKSNISSGLQKILESRDALLTQAERVTLKDLITPALERSI